MKEIAKHILSLHFINMFFIFSISSLNNSIKKEVSAFRACSHLTKFLKLNKHFYSISMGVRLALMSFRMVIRLAFYKH